MWAVQLARWTELQAVATSRLSSGCIITARRVHCCCDGRCCYLWSSGCCKVAASNPNRRLYLSSNGSSREWRTRSFIRWLDEHRTEGCTGAAMSNAAAEGRFEVMLLLRNVIKGNCSRERICVFGCFHTDEWVREYQEEAAELSEVELRHKGAHYNM